MGFLFGEIEMSRIVKIKEYIELVVNGYSTELELEIEGRVSPSEPQTHLEPGCGPWVDDLQVWASKHYDTERKIDKDFEPFLTRAQLRSFETTLIERYYDGI